MRRRPAAVRAGVTLALVAVVAVVALGSRRLLEAALGPLWAGRQADGRTAVPSSQTLLPAGKEVTFGGRPVDAALSPNGRTLAVLNSTGLLLLDTDQPKLRQTLAAEGNEPRPSFAGLAWSADGRRLYFSLVRGAVQEVALDGGKATLARSLAVPPVPAAPRRPVATPEDLEDQPPPLRSNSAVPGGLALSADGKRLYAALNRANTLAEFDLESGRLLRQVPVGVAPYGVALSRDGKTAYVSNWGGRRPHAGDPVAYSSGTGVVIDPGSGVASTGTVSVVDLESGRVEEVGVGLRPCAMLLEQGRLYIACAGSDTVSVLDTARREVVETISVHQRPHFPLGSAPIALAMVKDLLLVANAGNNAVAVIGGAPGRRRVLGMLPTGWYPAAVVPLRKSGRLAVANLKGLGSRNLPPNARGYRARDFLGSVNFASLNLLEPRRLARATETVVRNNAWDRVLEPVGRGGGRAVPVPTKAGERSVFKHVLYIIKENRTYDQVFGDMQEGNGDPSLAQFGEEVTPNHHALAREFCLLDNFYCSGKVSADGHQWTNEAYANDYLERFLGAGFPRSYPYEGSDPLAYACSGFLWDNALRHGKSFRCYGEFAQTLLPPRTTWTDFWREHRAGRESQGIRSATYVRSLKPHLHPTFPGFHMGIPDQVRVDIFLREFREFERRGDLPNLMVMLLPDDHTAGMNPGHPTPRAMVADNDLALGRIVEAVSKSRFWPETVIFVVEDDAQAGLDHVDGHRTVAFANSPYTRRRAVVSENLTQVSMVATIERVLGLPPMNQLDLAAPLMTACFTGQADLTAYTPRPNQIPLDEMNPPAAQLSQRGRYWLAQSLKQNFALPDAADEEVLDRVIWHATRGADTPYPRLNRSDN